METLIELTCCLCKSGFKRSKSKHNYAMSHGRKNIICSRRCTYKFLKLNPFIRKPKMVNLSCFGCGKDFKTTWNSTYMRRKRKSSKIFCSSICKNKFQKLGGELSPSWKGGRRAYPSRKGYIMLNVGPKRRMLEHRYVMEKHIGRKLTSKEVVHHLNENPSDNRIENLVLCKSAGEHHAKYHSGASRLLTNKNKPSGK